MRLTPALLAFPVAVFMSGCAYVIPPEKNAPRDNEVRGELRRPQLNGGAAPRMAPPAAGQPAVAPEEPQTALPSPVNNVAPAPANDARRVPVENQPFQVSAMGYEPITDVPPRPATVGPESTHEQLKATQSALERDRAAAESSRETLARDVAAEPSMLSELPAAEREAVQKPAVSPAPMAPLPSTTELPPPAELRRAPVENQPRSAVTLPNTQAFMPPEPLGAVPAAAQKPLQPVAMKGDFDPLAAAERPGQAIAASTLPAPSVAGPAVGRGDFDPLAAAEKGATGAAPVATTTAAPRTSRYAVNGYIAPSRYYTRRY